jgi:hypothetical protein
MSRDELIAELMKHPADAEIAFEYTYLPPCDCPDYCYCPYVTERKEVSTVDLCTINENAHRCPPTIVLRY